MTAYVNLIPFKNMLGLTVANLDEFIEECLETASRDVDAFCGRTFDKDTVATARTFRSLSSCHLFIDDCWEAPTLVKADDNDDAAYATTWATTDYELEPLNGIGPNGQAGWPYTTITAVEGLSFPTIRRSANVQVTAKWGWAAVPPGVKTATRRLAQQQFEARNAPFGAAGIGDIGVIRIRQDAIAMGLLAPFVRKPILVG